MSVVRNLANLYLEPWLPLCAKIEPYLSGYAPYSFVGYLTSLLIIFGIKKFVLGPKVKVPEGMSFVDNIFLALQSVGLVGVICMVYFDTAERIDIEPFSPWSYKVIVLETPDRFTSKWFDFGLCCFL